MEKVSRNQSITSKIFSIEKVNPFFSKVKIYIMYEGLNRNGSYLSRQAIDKALPTIFNTPIVGEFLADEQNFSGHGASVTKNTKGEYEMVLSTRPYGVVPESAQIYWESVTEDDGSERDYLVVDGAYLWSGRYPELHTFLDEGYYGQSMEIEIVNGNYSIQDSNEVFNVQDFVFTGFCLLGIDKESDMFGHVEPAFEKAKVELVAYSLDKDSFKSQFSQMIDELKFTLQEGESTKMEETQTQFVEGANAQDELKNRLGGVPSDVETEEVTQPENEVELTDPTEPTEGTQEGTEGSTDGADAPTEQEPTETETAPTDGADGVTEGGEATDGTFTVSLEEHEALKADFTVVSTELAELRTYKRNRELGDLKDRFSNQVSEKELQAIFEENTETPVEKLEIEIFALIGKKNFSLETKTNNKVSVVSPKVAEKQAVNPYGSIFN